jgi:uncharacterized protein (TIGR02996 family)
VTDHESFLTAIEAELADDALWLVFADWLEERGDPASEPIREAVERGDWDGCRDSLFRSLDRPRRLLAECDCVERVLPLWEAKFPHDPSPRRLLAAFRREGPDARVKRTRAALDRSCRFANRDWNGEGDEFEAALEAGRAVLDLARFRRGACAAAVYAAVIGVCGSDNSESRTYRIRPDRVAAQVAETRWQVARILRRRLEMAVGDHD